MPTSVTSLPMMVSQCPEVLSIRPSTVSEALGRPLLMFSESAAQS